MRPEPHEHETDESSELVSLLEKLTQTLRAGEPVSLSETVAEHPRFADEIRELWATILIAEDLLEADDDSDRSAATVSISTDDLSNAPQGLTDFLVETEIGRGGMGVVYRARQVSLDRDVALKVMRAGEGASSEARVRFEKEAEAAAKLDHPHIVPVYEVGSHEGRPYFVMRFVEGIDLDKRLRAMGPMDSRDAVRLILPIVRAIRFAHDHGVVHRDLKPSNVLLDEDETPYLTDFGLAKRMEAGKSITQSGSILGTPAYISPEQTGVGGKVGFSSDIYGLGAILYHMVTGRPPFQANSPLDLVIYVREEDPLAPRLLNPGVDRDLEMVILRCLQKSPSARYAGAFALIEDLEAFLAGDPVSARISGVRDWLTRILRESHHVLVLENWGLLWMGHSVVLIVVCTVTNLVRNSGAASRVSLLAIWGFGFSFWSLIMWRLRRRAGPITFVERQIAHAWAFSIVSSILLFWIEMLMDLDPLSLSPVIGLIGGSVFLVKAGILSGRFYFQAGALYLTAGAMAIYPDWAIALFGVVAAFCFFFPGLKYYRKARSSASAPEGSPSHHRATRRGADADRNRCRRSNSMSQREEKKNLADVDDRESLGDQPPRVGLSRGAKIGFLVFFVGVLGMLTVPGVPFANRERPFVLGMPFLLFWVILWVVISFLGQVVMLVMDRPGGEEEG